MYVCVADYSLYQYNAGYFSLETSELYIYDVTLNWFKSW